MLSAIAVPVVSGIAVGLIKMNAKAQKALVLSACALTAVITGVNAAADTGASHVVLSVVGPLELTLCTDGVSKIFSIIAVVMWLLAAVFSQSYMRHESKDTQPRYYAFLLVSLGMTLGMDFAGDMITAYLFYELITLTTFPLVLHSMRPEAIRAAKKYLFYSVAGGFMALFGIFFCYNNCSTLAFTAGGSLLPQGGTGIMLVAVFVAILGFGAKAGSYPLHGWLPTAHPEAPAPASALLSGVIAKAGVLAIIRIVFYVVGADLIAGTWVQYAWTGVALLTVFMGSMMAYREKLFKKRLAYSTVSQISYVLLGLSLLNFGGVTGALLHVIFHAVIKCGLFLVAGAIICKTGLTNIDDYTGIGKRMPVTLWCFTICSLALIGIPPLSGFVSKWYLASASLAEYPGALGWICVAVLLVSALLTAGYLLPVTVRGFFPGNDYKTGERCEADAYMLVPLIILAVAAALLGIFIPDQLRSLVYAIAGAVAL